MSRNLRGSLALLITALVWGVAFVFQSTAMEDIKPLLFSSVRFFLAGLVLIPIIALRGTKARAEGKFKKEERQELIKLSVKGGIICGIGLTGGSIFQQYALITTSAGKSAFITALYIILVPIAGIFIGKRINKMVWVSVTVAIAGFYLLCIKDGLGNIARGDMLCLCSAFVFTFQILSIDHFMEKGADPFILSCVEFFTVTALLFFPMLFIEGFHMTPIKKAMGSILYCGIMSGGVAYTCQVLGQRDAEPAIATLIMSLESVFAALAGWVLLHERLSLRELTGCGLVFAAVILAQLTPVQKKS